MRLRLRLKLKLGLKLGVKVGLKLGLKLRLKLGLTLRHYFKWQLCVVLLQKMVKKLAIIEERSDKDKDKTILQI